MRFPPQEPVPEGAEEEEDKQAEQAEPTKETKETKQATRPDAPTDSPRSPGTTSGNDDVPEGDSDSTSEADETDGLPVHRHRLSPGPGQRLTVGPRGMFPVMSELQTPASPLYFLPRFDGSPGGRSSLTPPQYSCLGHPVCFRPERSPFLQIPWVTSRAETWRLMRLAFLCDPFPPFHAPGLDPLLVILLQIIHCLVHRAGLEVHGAGIRDGILRGVIPGHLHVEVGDHRDLRAEITAVGAWAASCNHVRVLEQRFVSPDAAVLSLRSAAVDPSGRVEPNHDLSLQIHFTRARLVHPPLMGCDNLQIRAQPPGLAGTLCQREPGLAGSLQDNLDQVLHQVLVPAQTASHVDIQTRVQHDRATGWHMETRTVGWSLLLFVGSINSADTEVFFPSESFQSQNRTFPGETNGEEKKTFFPDDLSELFWWRVEKFRKNFVGGRENRPSQKKKNLKHKHTFW
jgi:hypothetical protein